MPYPYYRAFSKNVKQMLAPVIGGNVSVFVATTGTEAPIYNDSNGQSVITQPVATDENGAIQFYVDAGDIRVELEIDSRTNLVIYETIADADAIVQVGIESFIGTDDGVNGVNDTFTLNSSPAAARTKVYSDGLRVPRSTTTPPAADLFYIVGDTITLGANVIPSSHLVVDKWA